MSISLLLEKYDVSTDEGLQKALAEIEKEESEVDEALTSVLSRACTIEGRLRSASQGYNKLTEVKADAKTAADMVDKTAALAKDVSAKVRQLDLARSRVAECQRRVHDLIDLQLCSAGVEAAIKAHDYETGAAHVSRFLSMDPGSVAAAKARGAADPLEPMTKAANTLREHIVRKFEEAARKEDEPNIEKLFKLFPMIGQAEEGINLLSKYLAGQLEVKLRKASMITAEGSETVFADAVTRVVEAGAECVRRAAAMEPAGRGARLPVVPRALPVVQPQVCSAIRRVYLSLVSSRRLDVDGRGAGGGAGTGAAPSALQLEPVLGELALMLARIHLYCNFLRKRTEIPLYKSDLSNILAPLCPVQADVANLEESMQQVYIDQVEKVIASCDMTHAAQDLLGHYLTLERYFLEESVNKALRMSTPQPGDSTTSLVDDVFFIARKVISRAVSTGSVGGVCAALNEVVGALERCAHTVRLRLRTAPHDVLPLAPPDGGERHDALHDRLNRQEQCARALFLATLWEAESGAEWAARLAEEALAAGTPLCRRHVDRDQLAECAAGLASAHTAFTQASEVGRAAILSSLQPRVLPWAERLGAAPPAPGALPAALDALGEAARAQLPPATADWLLAALLAELATHAERAMLRGVFDAELGMEVEACCRRLAAWAGGAAPGARERAARLAQAAALLALEEPAHAPLALRPTPRIPLAQARDLLARRTDFKIEDIKRLKF